MFTAWVMQIRNPVENIMAWKKAPSVGEMGEVRVMCSDEVYPAQCTKSRDGLYDVIILTPLITESVISEVQNVTQPSLF